MKTIWKFPLTAINYQTLEIPKDAEVLTIQAQNGEPCLWARVDSDAAIVKRSIAIHGTGHSLPDTKGDYLGTYQMAQSALIFHVFEST